MPGPANSTTSGVHRKERTETFGDRTRRPVDSLCLCDYRTPCLPDLETFRVRSANTTESLAKLLARNAQGRRDLDHGSDGLESRHLMVAGEKLSIFCKSTPRHTVSAEGH